MNETAKTSTVPADTASEPLRAGRTPNLPGLLRERAVSLLVTTYQAGKLVAVREQGVFSGIAFTERLAPEERTFGVCVVDPRRGEPVACSSSRAASKKSLPSPCCRGGSLT
jgi:hypothetical protein